MPVTSQTIPTISESAAIVCSGFRRHSTPARTYSTREEQPGEPFAVLLPGEDVDEPERSDREQVQADEDREDVQGLVRPDQDEDARHQRGQRRAEDPGPGPAEPAPASPPGRPRPGTAPRGRPPVPPGRRRLRRAVVRPGTRCRATGHGHGSSSRPSGPLPHRRRATVCGDLTGPASRRPPPAGSPPAGDPRAPRADEVGDTPGRRFRRCVMTRSSAFTASLSVPERAAYGRERAQARLAVLPRLVRGRRGRRTDRPDRGDRASVGHPGAGAGADPLRPDARVPVPLLPGRGGDHGVGPRARSRTRA